MRTGMLPKSYLGKASVILAAASILLTVVAVSMVQLAHVQESNTATQLMGGASSILTLAAFAAGVTSIIWRKERAILIYLAMALLVLVFLLGEFMFPH